MPEEPREHMTFPQTDALVEQFSALLAGEVGISEFLATGLAIWQRGKTPYNLYVNPAWQPLGKRERAKAKGASA